MQGALPQAAVGTQLMSLHNDKIGAGCLQQHMVRRRESITRHSGQATTRSSIMGDNVPPCIQSRIDMSVESLGMTPMLQHIVLEYSQAGDGGL